MKWSCSGCARTIPHLQQASGASWAWSVIGLPDWGTSWLSLAVVLKCFGEVSPVCKVSIWEGDCPEEEGEN